MSSQVMMPLGERDLRVQSHVRDRLDDLDQFRQRLTEVAPSVVTAFNDIASLLRAYAEGQRVDPYTLTRRLDEFEETCTRNGFAPWRPDTVVGSLTRRLRNEVMGLADYLRGR